MIKHCKIILGEQFFHRDTLETKLMEYLNTLIYQHKCCDDRVEKRNDESRIESMKTQSQLQGDDPACPNSSQATTQSNLCLHSPQTNLDLLL